MEGLVYPHPSLGSPWAPAIDPDLALLMPWTEDPAPPVIWSVAGTDSGGAAGLSADTRAAAAMGVHLCPVVAAVTAQHSQGVQAVFPLPADQLRAQLSALKQDLPARVIKTGLLASAPAIDALLAQRGEALLVVDPVLGATAGGAAFCDEVLLSAYRHQLIPQAALLTPNRREAERLLGVAPGQRSVPELARGLRALGAQAVCITGGDDAWPEATLSLDWLDSPLATGWLALPRLEETLDRPLHHHGSGCTFATAAAAALARGFPVPDAIVLAKMLTWAALRDGHAAGAGPGPLRPSAGFVDDPTAMPVMSFADEEQPDPVTLARWERALTQPDRRRFEPGLYGIAEEPSRVAALAASGRFAHVQLRIKRTDQTTDAELSAAIRETLTATSAEVGQGTTLWINDHWRLAVDAGAQALHLGQEDWAALTRAERDEILSLRRHRRMGLGLSSHSLWELCRARGLTPSYVACGPVWPTTTKDMPWLPQGLAQLRWWARMAGYPVVAIGGILTDRQVQDARETGVAAVCLVRAAKHWAAAPALEPHAAG